MKYLHTDKFSVQIVRSSRRRTVSIGIKNDEVKVFVPQNLSENKINELVKSRSDWIQKKLNTNLNNIKLKPKNYIDGEIFTIVDKDYPLKISSAGKKEVKLTQDNLEVYGVDKNSKSLVRKVLINWHRDYAHRKLTEKTIKYSQIIGVTPRELKVRDYKLRWGTCFAKGDITYNWKIIVAPHNVIDYVVIHELCHLLEHNHSSKFWNHVRRFCPDFKEHKNWLLLNTSVLNLF